MAKKPSDFQPSEPQSNQVCENRLDQFFPELHNRRSKAYALRWSLDQSLALHFL